METENTVIFSVDPRANKIEIKRAFEASFKIKPERVNTLRTPDGRKKAYIKIPKTHEASEIANKYIYIRMVFSMLLYCTRS